MDKVNQVLISEFVKNSVEKVRISLQAWKGRAYLDVRGFFLDEKGIERPTKKRITLNVELLDDLKKAIAEAERILTEEDGGGHQVEVEEPTLGTEPIPDGEIPF